MLGESSLLLCKAGKGGRTFSDATGLNACKCMSLVVVSGVPEHFGEQSFYECLGSCFYFCSLALCQRVSKEDSDFESC